ncbi:MAG: hypothetical protein AUK16_01680 [Parcubacteria group bacterium CG2_30_44_11]|nr:MAG: hypothetical protein AUK16_01680 [Parcubacteria group bacterium CG2_30_44_11]
MMINVSTPKKINHRTCLAFAQARCPKLHQLYVKCVTENIQSIGHDKWHHDCALSIHTVQGILSKIGVTETAHRAPCQSISFYFGGQQQNGNLLTAREYLEVLAGYVHVMNDKSRQILELMAESTFLMPDFITVHKT